MAFNKLEVTKLNIPQGMKVSEICLQESVLREYANSILEEVKEDETLTPELPVEPAPVFESINPVELANDSFEQTSFSIPTESVEATESNAIPIEATPFPALENNEQVMDASPAFEPIVNPEIANEEVVSNPVNDAISEEEIIAAVKPVFDILDEKVNSGVELSNDLTVLYSALLFVNNKKKEIEHTFTK